MKRGKRWLLVSAALVLVLISQTNAALPFKKVSLAIPTASSASTPAGEAPTAEEEVEEVTKPENITLSAAAIAAKSKNSSLTGIPQIDYIWDPNLPRELRGYNLSSYPFFSTVPAEEDIHFECEGHHDGFYASIEHKCQLYHHCVYGIRHDFLCANFTAFDQKTFICHFVSDVDCDNSFKYWSRNDNLYMATTTTSTSTTTTEPPPTARRRPIARPNRPLRRPINRRPLDDYYYEDEEYDDDYYEERLNRRRKQRPRQRKPVVDYEDEYEDEKRSFGDDDKPARRHSARDRHRVADEELDINYDVDRRKQDRTKSRGKVPATSLGTDKRKTNARKPGTIGLRPAADERRSFPDERPALPRRNKQTPAPEEPAESEELPPAPSTPPRRILGRRRIGEKRPAAIPAEEEDEVEQSHASDNEDNAEEEPAAPKEKTTPKPLEEFVTPKAAPASVYARPRAPPRIARPVPVNEKKKFKYPVQKAGATTASPVAHVEDEEYYEEELYEEPIVQPRRRIHADIKHDDEDALPPPAKRRGVLHELPGAAGRKTTRTTLRKPVTDKKHLVAADEDAEYDSAGSASDERINSRTSARRRPFSSRNRGAFSSARGADDVDFVDDDYEERPLRPAHRLRPNNLPRKNLKKSRPQVVEDEDEPLDEPEPDRPFRSRGYAASVTGRRKNIVTSQRLRQSTAAPVIDDVAASGAEEDPEEPETVPKSKTLAAARPNAVRVVKRPFLPSRGGSPYLPRGLQPVGVALKSQSSPSSTTASTPIDMGSTISGVRLLELGAPILRNVGTGGEAAQGPRTTLPPRSPISVITTQHARDAATPQPPPPPKVSLDELYENDYDVTLNDALNPTLKPLTSHQSHLHNNRQNYPSAFLPSAQAFVDDSNNEQDEQNNKQMHAIHQNNNNNNYQNQPSHTNAYPTVPQSQIHHQQQLHLHQPSSSQHQLQPNYNSDSYFSSTDIRRRAIVPAAAARSSRADYRSVSARIAQHFYDDLEY